VTGTGTFFGGRGWRKAVKVKFLAELWKKDKLDRMGGYHNTVGEAVTVIEVHR
jgi:hypothetical protein